MKNNKGFAISGIIYISMLIFLLFLLAILGILASNKVALDKIKNDTLTDLKEYVELEKEFEEIVYNFEYTGDYQIFNVEESGTYKIELWGASYSLNFGGYVSGNITLNKSTNLYIYIGGTTSQLTGGYNGGGDALLNTKSIGGVGGNGATDIRIANGVWNNATSLNSRIMVAAGAGNIIDEYSEYSEALAGKAGGLIGYDANNNDGWLAANGKGGGQTTGGSKPSEHSCATKPPTAGSFGIGGNGGASSLEATIGGGGGGGGGYYGGSGSSGLCNGFWFGGGGSSYISGHTGSVAITSETSQSPKTGCITGTSDNACSIHYSGLSFTNTVMIDGAGYKWTNVKGEQVQMPKPTGGLYNLSQGHSGNGYARITRIS